MAFLKALVLPSIVLGILVFFSHMHAEGFRWSDDAGAFEPTIAAGPAEETPGIPDLPTPTGTATVDEDVPQATVEASPVVEEASATATSERPSPTAEPSETPAPTETSVPFTPTPTEVLPDDLPALSDDIDNPATVATATIGTDGGRIASPDGRVVIDFPAGATREQLSVSITKRSKTEFDRVSPDQTFVSVWQFDAVATGSRDAVHTFDSDVRITTRFSVAQLAGLNVASLAFWTLNEDEGRWEKIPASVDIVERAMTIRVNHFSIDAATATNITDLAPLLDGRLTDLHTGSSSLNIPIAVPPGRNGLAPSLNLSYDSGRVAEQREYTSMASWVGTGWELGVGSIDVSDVPYDEEDPDEGSYSRYFLNAGNFGGEIIQGKLANNPYLKISYGAPCYEWHNQFPDVCAYTVTDQSGTKYIFGATENARRYYCLPDYDFPICQRFYYRYDLSKIQDTLGNEITVSYVQQSQQMFTNGNYYQWIASSYPDTVTYNGGLAQVKFNREFDGPPRGQGWYGSSSVNIETRADGPYLFSNSSNETFIPPPVLETHRLDSVDVNVKVGSQWKRVRKYDFTYITTNFDPDTMGTSCYPSCAPGTHHPWRPKAGTIKLDSVQLRNTTDTSTLVQMDFDYENKQWTYYEAQYGYSTVPYDLPLLTAADNGFGGRVEFQYTEKQKTTTGVRWSRQVVTQEKHIPCHTITACASQPPIITTFDYGAAGSGPDWNHHTNLANWGFTDTFKAAYRGFPTVTESDSANNQIVHSYYTTDLDGSHWNDEILTGREKSTTIKDAAGVQWKKIETDWRVREVAAQESTLCSWPSCPIGNPPPDPNHWYVNFVYADSQTTTLKDGQLLKTVNTYDDGASAVTCRTTPFPCYGLLTKVEDLGDPNSQGAYVRTETTYNKNTTEWLFQPRLSVVKDSGGTELSRSQFYYDGNQLYSPASPPADGLLTASAAKLNATDWSSTYNVYDQWGNRLKQSVPMTGQPNQYSQGAALGWIPSGVKFSESTFDSTYHLFPLTETSPITTLTTTYDYTDAVHGNYLFGKPTKITEPNAHWTEIRYDTFGRTTHAWDNLDSSSLPTVSFSYTWSSTLPSSTLVTQRVESGTTKVRQSITCMDGFGRTLQTSEHYDANAVNKVRLDYDARGNQAVVTNPQVNGSTIGCPGSFPLIDSSVERTTYQYDPLGNMSVAMQIDDGQTVGPHTRYIDNGTTSISIDEKYRRTVSTRNIGGLTTTVTEPLVSLTLRQNPSNGQGGYGAWAANPAVAHYLNVDDTSPDDVATYITSTTPGARDSHRYVNANLTSGSISNVIFHFRWKQDVPPTSAADTGVKPFLRWALQHRFGPLHHRTSADGWVDEYWELPINPVTNLPWTLAGVNGLEFGFETGATGSAPVVTQAWVEVVTQAPTDAQTVYTNDKLGRLVKVRDALMNETTMSYDMGGRKTGMVDPDMGTWSYTYGPAGNLLTQTDARSITSTLGYDDNLRLTTKSYSGGGTPSVAYHYDSYEDTGFCAGATATAKGQLTRMTDGGGSDGAGKSALSCFDIRGRVEKNKRYIDSTAYTTQFSNYDNLGQARTVTYPDNDVVTYGVNNDQGFITSMSSDTVQFPVQNLVTNIVRTPWGATASISLGTTNALVTSYAFDHRLRLSNITTANGTSIQNLSYAFDDASNVVAVSDSVAGESLAYTYDQLDRLTAMSINTTSQATYTYNQIGNLLSKVEGTNTATMTYPTSGQGATRPHAATALSGTANFASLTYDANGNLTGRSDGTTYAYDAENRMTQRPVSGGTVNYVYDGDGGLLKKTEPGSSTAYVGGIYELKGGTATKYYSVAGKTIAMRKGLSIVYLLSDHLGSSTTLTGSNGVVTGTLKYWPFGMTRATTGSVPTDKLYTGQQQEPGDVLEMYHYNARVYSTLMGRFLGVDPIAGSNPQRLNPYSYVANNPMRYTDPSGMCLPDIDCPGDQGTQETELLETAVESWADSRSIEQTRDGCDAACQMQVAADAFADAAHQQMVDALHAVAAIQHAQTVATLQYLNWANGRQIETTRAGSTSGPVDDVSSPSGLAAAATSLGGLGCLACSGRRAARGVGRTISSVGYVPYYASHQTMTGVSNLPVPAEIAVRTRMGPQGHALAIGLQVAGLSVNVAGDAIETAIGGANEPILDDRKRGQVIPPEAQSFAARIPFMPATGGTWLPGVGFHEETGEFGIDIHP